MTIHNQECLALLERLRWDRQPRCQYCQSTRSAALSKENRFHCNACFTSYSATVGTIFHGTRVDLKKWYVAIYILINQAKASMSARKLAQLLEVNKDTAATMKRQILGANEADSRLVQQLSSEIERLSLFQNLDE